jgi:hypothetical protein
MVWFQASAAARLHQGTEAADNGLLAPNPRRHQPREERENAGHPCRQLLSAERARYHDPPRAARPRHIAEWSRLSDQSNLVYDPESRPREHRIMTPKTTLGHMSICCVIVLLTSCNKPPKPPVEDLSGR